MANAQRLDTKYFRKFILLIIPDGIGFEILSKKSCVLDLVEIAN